MSLTKTIVGRRHFLIATGLASAGALTSRAAVAGGQVSTAISSNGTNQPTTIKGVVAEKPVHKVPSTEELLAGYVRGPSDVLPPGMSPAKGTPAVCVDHGKYSPGNSKTDAVSAGKVEDAWASGLKISAKEGDVGGVRAQGIGTDYVIADANIDLSGDGEPGLGGPDSGASVNDYATLTIRNSTITMTGSSRNAIASQNHGILKVYNSTLIANGDPFTPDITKTDQKRTVEIDGNSRCTVTMSNSYSYFNYCTVIANGWAALSTDMSDGFSYLEANYCKVRTITSGYGTYSDFGCHNHINSCDFDVACMAGTIAGEADLSFRDTKAKCGTYFAMILNIGQPNEVSTLKVIGGEVTCKSAGVLVKSSNADILFDGVKIASESGILLKSVTCPDPFAAKAAHTKGQNVYGIHATYRNMDVSGDIDHSGDKDNRRMTVYLESTTLRGAIKDALISMNRSSKWIATADSNVTIVGDIDVLQIDAPAGVTITAVASVSGSYKLASGGNLILKAS